KLWLEVQMAVTVQHFAPIGNGVRIMGMGRFHQGSLSNSSKGKRNSFTGGALFSLDVTPVSTDLFRLGAYPGNQASRATNSRLRRETCCRVRYQVSSGKKALRNTFHAFDK